MHFSHLRILKTIHDLNYCCVNFELREVVLPVSSLFKLETEFVLLFVVLILSKGRPYYLYVTVMSEATPVTIVSPVPKATLNS